MQLRHYQPGDEEAQAVIYNTAAASLPAFKPASAEEIARRYRGSDSDPTSKVYAVEGHDVVGYAVLNPNGRISYPWCLAGFEACRPLLLANAIEQLRRKGLTDAWVAYRADWTPINKYLEEQGFRKARDILNYAIEIRRLPHRPLSGDLLFVPVERSGVAQAKGFAAGLFSGIRKEELEEFYFENTYFDPASLFALKRSTDDQVQGIALAIVNQVYADPTKIDPAMPCFRLGAMGTEKQRHKRVNGMFSCVFSSVAAGELLLAEAGRRFTAAGLTHAAAQAPSDQPVIRAFYERYFQRQGAFPILAKAI